MGVVGDGGWRWGAVRCVCIFTTDKTVRVCVRKVTLGDETGEKVVTTDNASVFGWLPVLDGAGHVLQ